MNGRAGYVSLLAAATIALLAVTVLMYARAQDSAAPALRRLEREVRLEAAAQNAEAHVGFVLASQPLSMASAVVGGERGLAPSEQIPSTQVRNAAGAPVAHLMLDGRRYALGSALVSVQDESGLLNLNTPDADAVTTLLAEAGVERGAAAALASAFAERSAEGWRARAAGDEAPDQAALRSPWALLALPGWRRNLDAEAAAAFFGWSSAAPDTSGINVNTAPEPVLQAALGANAMQIRRLMALRQGQPFRDLQQVQAVLGLSFRAEGARPSVAPDSHFRMVVQLQDDGDGGRWIYQTQLVLGRGEAARPVYCRQGAIRRVSRPAVRNDEVDVFPTGPGFPA